MGLLALLSCFARPANAATIAVNTTTTSLANDALCGLREAVIAINLGTDFNGCKGTGYGTNDRINVPAGTYATSTTMNVTRSVIIEGAGIGATTVKGGAPGFHLKNNGSDLVVTFEKMTLSPNSVAASPIGIQGTTSTTGTLTLDLLAVKLTGFTTNSAVYLSAPAPQAVAEYRAHMNVADAIITGNYSGLTGSGAVEALVERSVISQQTNSGFSFVGASKLQLHYCVVENNSSPGDGAGIYLVAASSDPFDVAGSHVHISNSIVSGNNAGGDGGGMYVLGRSGLDMYQTTVTGNSAGGSGGGIFCDRSLSGYCHLYYSTVAFNGASDQGGGAWMNGVWGSPSTDLNRSIIAKNSLDGSGAASGSGTDLYAPNGINGYESLFGTRQGFADGCYDLGGTDCWYSIFRPATASGTLDPRLGALKYLGGPTRVHPLLADSPAVDAAPPMDSDIDREDQRGMRRTVDGDFSWSETEQDIGAYELGAYDALGVSTWIRPSSMTYTEAGTGKVFVELFVTESDTKVYTQRAEVLANNGLGPWSSRALLTSANAFHGPSVIPFTNNEAYIFVIDGTLWYRKRLANYTLGSWVNLGSSTAIDSAPSAVNVNNQQIWVFVTGQDRQIKYRVFSNNAWSAWSSAIGTGVVQSEPAAVYLGGTTNRIYVFARKDGVVSYKSCAVADGACSGSWTAWTNVDSTIVSSGVGVTARGTNRIELCANDNFGGLSCNTRTNTTWGGWRRVPTSTNSVDGAPAVSTRPDNDTVDIFVLRGDNTVERHQLPY
jgi:predicted outer membrane repeat protein